MHKKKEGSYANPLSVFLSGLLVALFATSLAAQEGKEKFIKNLTLISGIQNYASGESKEIVDLSGWFLQTEIWYGKVDKTMLSIEAAFDKIDGWIEEIPKQDVESNFGRFKISLEQRINNKFYINPRYLYQFDMDPVREVTEKRVSAHAPTLYIVIRPKKSLFFYPGFSIFKLSNDMIDYYSYLEMMYYLREYDYFMFKGFVNTNKLYNTISYTAALVYNFQFPKFISNKLFWKFGATLGWDRYNNSGRIQAKPFLWQELKYEIAPFAISTCYKRTKYYDKNTFGIQFIIRLGG